MRHELVDVPGREADPGDLVNLSAYLEAETEQRGTAPGPVVSVGFVNSGKGKLPLLNPFELLQFQVRDEQGFPLRVPSKAPSLLTHKRAGEPWRLESPLPIVSVVRNGRETDPSAVDSEILDIGPGEDYRVSFAIDRFLGRQGDDAGGETAIPDGTYTVRCIATLIHAEQRQTSRILQSDEIEIRFARRAA
jgi:hypothetical protein